MAGLLLSASRSTVASRIRHAITSARLRFLSQSAIGANELSDDESLRAIRDNRDLRSRILGLRLPKRSATNAIQKWVAEGNRVTLSELRLIAKELRQMRRYKHALEITEWMVAGESFELLDSDIASRVDLLSKVFGSVSAERYFESLPLSSRTCETYSALLHSYAATKQVERAEELYQTIMQSNIPLSPIVFNEMMTLYISMNHVDEVLSVMSDLHRSRVPPDIFTYNLWICSLASSFKLNEVKTVLEQMKVDCSFNADWLRYTKAVNLYIVAGNLTDQEVGSVVEVEREEEIRQIICYDFAVMLHVGLGNKNKLGEIWESLKKSKKKMAKRDYVCIVSSHLMVGNVKEVGEIIDQWRDCASTEFDSSVFSSILNALYAEGLPDIAHDFRGVLSDKNLDLQ